MYRHAPSFSGDMQRCGRAMFAARRSTSARTTVSVLGEIDAVNSRVMARYVEAHTGVSRQLLLDLRAVDFFGGHGFTALYYISVHCARSDVDWVIIGAPPVRRLLDICDADGELPLVDDLVSALVRLDRCAQCRRHVVPVG
ncbi:STAS domain-containing protein [Mycobacterium sp. ACS1612]|uniref:STAS domain-containing protein n=1 Tax=Mycobacterium sp. ACS1612 TaxID=1834117 RepID=UPI001E2B516F|nr:STAS domain-containing protein [Mycobacterium sp. ACS1612]